MQIEMKDYLVQNNKEKTPDWLKNYTVGGDLDFVEVFQTKSVFYPGCGDDGRAIKLFSRAHAAHLFFYVDCGIQPKDWIDNLKKTPIDGYRILDTKELSAVDFGLFSESQENYRNNKDLMNILNHYRNNLSRKGKIDLVNLKNVHDRSFCYFVIFERDENHGDSHGVDRFAIAFIYEDAIPLYATLFALPLIPAPTWLVVQSDMATNGLFGRGEPLEQVANAIQMFPDYLLVSNNAESWEDYSAIKDVKPHTSKECAGKHWSLYERSVSNRAV